LQEVTDFRDIDDFVLVMRATGFISFINLNAPTITVRGQQVTSGHFTSEQVHACLSEAGLPQP